MSSRRNNLIVLALVVVLLGVAAYFIFIDQPVTESTQLGLDLQGGVSAQLKGSQTGGGKVTRQEMEQSADLIRQRIDRLGVSEPDVRVQSENQIVVQIPGVKNPEEVIRIIGSTAQLGFYQVLASEPSPLTRWTQHKMTSGRTSRGTMPTRKVRRRSCSARLLPCRAMASKSWATSSTKSLI